jgi:hypothetical protein
MRLPWRRATAAGKAADDVPGWFGPPRLAERSCCCPARPVVVVLIPAASERRHPVDLLLCGHHYLSSKAALAVAGAVVIDETGSIVDAALTGIPRVRTVITLRRVRQLRPPGVTIRT